MMIYRCLSTFSPSAIPSHRASISFVVLYLEKLTRSALSARSLLNPMALSTWLGLPLAQALPEDTYTPRSSKKCF